MTITMVMVLFGALLVYCGWKNLDVIAALKGDNTRPKRPVVKSTTGVVGS